MPTKFPDPPSDREFDFSAKGKVATLNAIQADAVAAIGRLGPGTRANIVRAAMEDLRFLADIGEPVPMELVELIARLVNEKPARARRRTDRKKFLEVAIFLGDHPDATDSALRRKFNVDRKVLKLWRSDEEFQKLGELNAGLAAIRLKKTRKNSSSGD